MHKQPAVLVVEDDLSWQMIYQEILEGEGYLVELAANRDEASSLLESHVFDVAIIDLRLVDQDPKNTGGLQVVKLLRDLQTSTRIIVKSGYLTEAVRQQLLGLGVFSVLDKEGSVRQLTGLVASAAHSARSGR